MKFRKKGFYTAALIAGSFAIIAFGAISYGSSQSSDLVNNQLEIATLEGNLEENFVPDKDIQIGGSYAKDVKVTNKGTTNLFVRVMILPKVQSSNGLLLPAAIGKELSIDLNTDWIDGGDGYYYYLDVVKPEIKTSALFTSVTLSNNLDQRYEGASLSVQLKSEAVTPANHEYRKAWWAGDVPTTSPLLEIDQVLQLKAAGG